MSPGPTTDWVRIATAAQPEAPALVSSGRTLTYAQLDRLVERRADELQRLTGLSPGSRIGVVADRSIATVAALWAVWRRGAVAVVIDPGASATRDESLSIAKFGLRGIVVGDEIRLVGSETAPPPDDPAHHTWVPTSGSVAGPRTVILTHRNVAAAVDASQRRLGNVAGDRWLLVLPLFHVGGLAVLWRSAAAGGCAVLHDEFDAAAAGAALHSGAVTFVSLVPTMLHRILDERGGGHDAVRCVLLGGAAASPDLVGRALAAGLPVRATYGMTEACSQIATVSPGRETDSIETVGQPLDGFTVTIDGPDERGVGEIVVDGPAVSPGYVGQAPHRGPLRTGDLGRLDEEGRLVVTGRSDDVIVTGGENVNPSTVEAALTRLPAVADAAVFGVPDAEWGELVVAAVVPAGDVPTPTELDRLVKGALSPAQRPRRWLIVEQLPRLPNGKVDRRSLRNGV